jgi:hypothetical protein
MVPGKNRNSNVIRAYLLALSMLGLGLAGVVVIASQASRSLSGGKPSATDGATAKPSRAPDAMVSGPAVARPRPKTPDSGAPPPRPRITPDAGLARTPDAAAPMRPVATPDAAVPSTGPPKHAGPAPVLVVEFRRGSTRPSKRYRRAIRKLVREHGYKNVRYKLTGYGAERRKPKNNRALARRRCRKVARLIRKRGVSRRWIECGPPVFRSVKRKPTDADRAPAWRRVEIRVEKPKIP